MQHSTIKHAVWFVDSCKHKVNRVNANQWLSALSRVAAFTCHCLLARSITGLNFTLSSSDGLYTEKSTRTTCSPGAMKTIVLPCCCSYCLLPIVLQCALNVSAVFSGLFDNEHRRHCTAVKPKRSNNNRSGLDAETHGGSCRSPALTHGPVHHTPWRATASWTHCHSVHCDHMWSGTGYI